MSDWQTEPLDNCLEALLDYRGKSPPKSAKGIPVLSAKVVKTTGLLRPIEQKIAIDYYPKWMVRGLPRVGDVVMTTEAPMGEVIQLDAETVRYALGQRIVCMRGKPKKLDNTFLRYVLTSPAQQAILASYATGTTVLGISQKALRSVPITYPDFGEQKRIGELLGALDDKIELNRRMNETLEATARAIFKDWFADFGPTRAKIEGRPPYLAPEIWSLFPENLDDEGKPEGWIFGTLGDVARQVGESVKPEALDPGTPYIGLEHMPRKSIALSDWEGAGKVTSGKLAFRKGDFLFGKLRPYFHKAGIAPVDGICSTDIVVLNARERKAAAFVLACISQDEFVAFTDRTSDGTKMPRTSWRRMERYGLCLPGGSALEAFNACVEPMLDRIVSNIHESRKLAATRDLLLPNLMSGEVRINEAEKFARDER
jgi:type I restriction enzyme S subunit